MSFRATKFRTGLADGAGCGAGTDSVVTARETAAGDEFPQSAGQLASTVAISNEAGIGVSTAETTDVVAAEASDAVAATAADIGMASPADVVALAMAVCLR